jgi:hypothetical protein
LEAAIAFSIAGWPTFKLCACGFRKSYIHPLNRVASIAPCHDRLRCSTHYCRADRLAATAPSSRTLPAGLSRKNSWLSYARPIRYSRWCSRVLPVSELALHASLGILATRRTLFNLKTYSFKQVTDQSVPKFGIVNYLSWFHDRLSLRTRAV